jgi:ankyrin repeat protein
LANAVAYRKLESARLLLERGAGVDLADGNGVTPLMIAARKSAYMNDAKPFVQLLLTHKARKDLTHAQDRTPFQIAEAAQNSSVLDLLKGR